MDRPWVGRWTYISIYIYTCIYVHLDSANPAAVPSNDHISHQKEKGKPSTQEYLWRGCVCFQEGKHYNISVNPQWHDMTVQEGCDHIHRWDALRLPETSWLILLAGSQESTSTSEPVMPQKLGTPKTSQQRWLIYIFENLPKKLWDLWCLDHNFIHGGDGEGEELSLSATWRCCGGTFFFKKRGPGWWGSGEKYHPFMYMIYILYIYIHIYVHIIWYIRIL